MSEDDVLAEAVELILRGRAEEALKLLSDYYKTITPSIKIGLPKGCRKAYGCYTPRNKTIYLRSSDEFTNPFVVLHEYYHHLRYRLGRHRGTEKHADQYAVKALVAWQRVYARREA